MTSTLGGASVASLVGGSVASVVGVSVAGGSVASGVADSAGVDGASLASDRSRVAAGDSAGPDDSGPPDAGADSAGVVSGAGDSTGCPEVSGPELAAAVPLVGLGVAVGVALGGRRRVPVLQREDVDRARLCALLHDDDLAAVGRHDRVELPLRADVAERGDVGRGREAAASLPRPGTAG